jgi:hypothetical protein
MSDTLADRDNRVNRALAHMCKTELDKLTHAANHGPAGGLPLTGSLLDKAVNLELAFAATGRLRNDVLKLFSTELD